MIKVGLMTYHYVCNEGALWQAYSLQNAFNEFAPYIDMEIANYQLLAKSNWNKSTFPEKKRNAFETFRNSFVNSNSIKESDLKNFDGLIVGSDIVWQFAGKPSLASVLRKEFRTQRKPSGSTSFLNRLRGIKQRGKRLSKSVLEQPSEWTKLPNVYWLPWQSVQKKISFAASMGYSQPDQLTDESKSLARSLLADFDLISVRDNHTKAFVEHLLGKDVYKVADPAWLYTDPLIDVASRLERLGWDGSTPLAGVLYPRGNRYGQQLDDWVLDDLRRQGFTTVSIIDANPNVDIDLAGETMRPFDWWSVIAQLDFLLTVRTHPNIAALKYHTPFLNLDITSAIQDSNVSKSEDMLAEFGLQDLCVFRHKDLKEGHIKQRLHDALSRSWDWQAIDRQIENHRKTAIAFIHHTASLFD
jgi:hypothetical protein